MRGKNLVSHSGERGERERRATQPIQDHWLGELTEMGDLCIDTDSFFALIKGSIDAGLSEGSRMIAKSTRSVDA